MSAMLVDLKLKPCYDGLLYLADPARHLRLPGSHRHAELELNLVLAGSLSYVMNGRRFTFTPRSLLWLFPEQEHQVVEISRNGRYYVAVFKPSLIERACHLPPYLELARGPDPNAGVLCAVLDPTAFALVRNVMDSLMRDSLDSDVLNREAGYGAETNFYFEHHDADTLNAGLHYLLLYCWRQQLAWKSQKEAIELHPAVRRALKRLQNADCDRNLADLAMSCGVSSAYLSRTFNHQVGVPLNRYRNSLRLSRFFEHYRSPQRLTIAEAVYAAGFGSYAQFYKVFTRSYGRGPRECLNRRYAENTPILSRKPKPIRSAS